MYIRVLQKYLFFFKCVYLMLKQEKRLTLNYRHKNKKKKHKKMYIQELDFKSVSITAVYYSGPI